VTVRRGKGSKQLLYDRKKKRGYWKSTEEALDHVLWRSRFGIVYGHILKETRMN